MRFAKIIFTIFAFVGSLFFLAFLITPIPMTWDGDALPKKMTNVAQIFGDIAGTVISTMALVFVIVTITKQNEALSQQEVALEMQKKSLEAQLDELRLTREEMRASQAELAKTATAQQGLVDAAQLAARLEATVALLNHYKSEIEKLEQQRNHERFTTAVTEAREKFFSGQIVNLNRVKQEAIDEIDGLRNRLRKTWDVSAHIKVQAHIESKGVARQGSNTKSP